VHAKKITEGAITLAIYTVMLLLFLYIPIFGLVLNLFLPIPFIYYTAKYNWKDGMLIFGASLVLTFIVGTLLAIPVTFVYGVVGIVMGWCLYKNKDHFITFSLGALTFLSSIVLIYVASVLVMNINYIDVLTESLDESLKQSIAIMESIGQDVSILKDMYSNFTGVLLSLLPSMLMLTSAVIIGLVQWISIPILKRLGMQVPEGIAFRELSLPKSTIWYYFAAVILSFLIPAEEGTFIFNVITNIVFILQTLFVFQGITFIFYYCYIKGKSKVLPVIGTVLIILSPIFSQLARLIGIIDLGFDLRKRIEGK
jgi:uncharacterized protein YybS (DUF2232 family)